MTIRLDHTIVHADDKVASAEFFAEIFGLEVQPGHEPFAQVRVNDSLTLDFADDSENADRTTQHYAFHVSHAEFEAICNRVANKSLAWGDSPHDRANKKFYSRNGGRGFYFDDPNGHILEVMTQPETGS